MPQPSWRGWPWLPSPPCTRGASLPGAPRRAPPRAGRLRPLRGRLAERAGALPLFETAETVYRVMKAETDLPVNVDFYSAVIYRALGIPIDLCTSIFAVARVAGWGAPPSA